MAWIIGNNPIIIKPDTGQCIKLNGSTILDLEKICADDVMVLPDRIGTGKTLYSYVKNNEGIDQSNRAVSYNSGSTDKVFYNSGSTFITNFKGNIPLLYQYNDLRLIPEKYLRTAEESSIEARNLPCALTKVVHSNNLLTDPKDLELCGTYTQYGDEKVISKSFGYYIYPEIIPTPLSGVYDYHPLLINLNDNTQTKWESTGNSGSVGIYYKLIGQNNQFLVRPSIRYSLELSWEDSTKVIKLLYPIGLSSSVFDKIGNAHPLGNKDISEYSYVRYKSKYGSTYSDTLSPTASSDQDVLNLRNIRGIAIYNNYANISLEAFREFKQLKEVLFANSDATYEDYGLKYGLLRIGNKAFYWDYLLTTIKTLFRNLESGSTYARQSLPDSVNSLGIAAFFNTSLNTLTLCNTQITNIPTDCFYSNNFTKLTISDSTNNPSTGELLISSNTKLGSAALRSNTELTTISGLKYNVLPATFFGCTKLDTITTSPSNEITSIGDVSFAYCPLKNSSDLLVKVLPKVRNVGMGAFYNSDISGSIGIMVPTCFNKFAFADDNNLGNIDEISFQDGSLLDDFCLYGLKNLTNLTNLIGCNLSSYALDGSRVIEVDNDLYEKISYISTKRSDISGNNDLIYTINGTSGWFYDAFSNDSKGIRAPYLPVGVYLGSTDKCIFYKFHPLGGGKSTIHSGLQDYYIHPNTVAVHEVTCSPKIISKNDNLFPFVSINDDIDHIFKNAYNSYKVSISDLNVYMFNTVSAGSCKNLTKIVDYAFKELDHKSFVFPSNGPLKYLGKGAFQGCSNLESVTNLLKLTGLTVILDSTFSGCDLESIDLPDTIETIGSYAFNGNSYLKKVTFGGITTPTKLTKIGSHAFYGTDLDDSSNMEGTGLTLINNLISKCTSIGSYAFANVLNLIPTHFTVGTVKIPKCCTYLGECAFNPISSTAEMTLDFSQFTTEADVNKLTIYAPRRNSDVGALYIRAYNEDRFNQIKNKIQFGGKYNYKIKYVKS